MTAEENLFAARKYLRRTKTLQELKDLADQVAANGAFESVTITGDAHEGTSSSGVINFPPGAYLAVIEELIAELDASVEQVGPMVMQSDFSRRCVRT